MERGSASRCRLNLAQQKRILDLLDENRSLISISKLTGIPRTTISGIKSRKYKILAALKRGMHSSKVGYQENAHPELELALNYWFWQQKVLTNPMTTDILRQKAMFFHTKMCSIETCSFCASNGWISKFKIRNGLQNSSFMIEKPAVKVAAEDLFRQTLVETIGNMGFGLDQIFSADELLLYWRKLPSETLVALDEKTLKDKVSVIACSNVTGTCRIPLQVVSRSCRPLCPPTSWVAAEKIYCTQTGSVWNSSSLFKDWFQRIFTPTVLENSAKKAAPPKALLLLSSNKSTEVVESDFIKILIIPSCLSQCFQPMNQPSISLPLRAAYRKRLLEHVLTTKSNWVEVLMNLDIKNVIELIHDSWVSLANANISKSWDKLLTGHEMYQVQLNSSPTIAKTEADEILKLLIQVNEHITVERLLDWMETSDGPWNECMADEKIIELAKKEDFTNFQATEDSSENSSSNNNHEESNFVEVEMENGLAMNIKTEDFDDNYHYEDDESEMAHDDEMVQEFVRIDMMQERGNTENNDVEEHKVLEYINGLIKFYSSKRDKGKLRALKKWKNEFLEEIKCQI